MGIQEDFQLNAETITGKKIARWMANVDPGLAETTIGTVFAYKKIDKQNLE